MRQEHALTTLNATTAASDLMQTLRPATPPEPLRARRISTEPAEEGPAMPRGVYERKPKGEKKEGEKPKRKWTRRAKPSEDLKAMAAEALLDAARHLHATVIDQVEISESEELQRAVRSFELADKISKAAK
jgi:hypothetical protein